MTQDLFKTDLFVYRRCIVTNDKQKFGMWKSLRLSSPGFELIAFRNNNRNSIKIDMIILCVDFAYFCIFL